MSRWERFYCPSLPKEGEAWIGGGEAHHMLHVLRLKPGQRVYLFDGRGMEATARILETRKDSARLEIENSVPVNREARIAITLAFSIPKGQRAEMLVEKTCELGVSKLIPMECHRSVVKFKKEGSHKLEKWRRIAIEASKQCGRTYITEVEEITPFSALLEETGRYELSLIASPGLGERPLKEVVREHNEIKTLLCMTGPEGGFTEEELERAKGSGSLQVSIVPRILRIETAAIALMSMLLFAYGFQFKCK
ncbi:MAG TPA: 16S rRNA (uracil(1498)-N(3))-methyltransferase [Candidatus Hypogeohydataceae bacterium YC41]